ncbi:TPM domain-containing protein [Acinetobacter lanii]|uniref:TPM domain-containing protein n=1 Tax=Acinetobacter lanii TaxID=2715163 RepID=A0A6G8S8G4_9GAMM|nr:TPM domain-containing protein [Acinetobacter lanii]QIO10457.1 TPM domain-containing protein [Acinetobacter lanii]
MMLLTLSISSVSMAETATATADDVEDVIIAKKIIQPNQQTQPNPNHSASAQPQPESLNVENDLAEGESIRQLPTLNAPVIDQANVLSSAEKLQLDAKIRALHAQGKTQIGVIIVPTTGQESIFDFAMRSAEQWKLGSAKQDNGLLIAVAVNDHRLHIATGYGLEGVIPDIIASRIIRDQITPYFKQNQYGQGLISGVTEIERILNQDPETAQKAAEELKERQAQALQEQQAKEKTFSTVLFILIAGIIGSFIIGNRLSASVAGATAVGAGLMYGSGIVMSLMLGFGVFFLLFTSIAQLIFRAFLSGAGRGGGGGGFGGGGGYSGGGGGFGGGGASGSW